MVVVMVSRRLAALGAVLGVMVLVQGAPRAQQPQAAARELAIKYTRDAEEYATLARQAYRIAGDALSRTMPAVPGRPGR